MDRTDRVIFTIGFVSGKINSLKRAGFKPKTIIMNTADAVFIASLYNRQQLPIAPPISELLGLPVVIREVDEIQVGV